MRALSALLVTLTALACSHAHDHALAPTPHGAAATQPALDVSHDRIGVEIGSALPRRFVGTAPPLAGHVVLVRWWTDGCPHCEESLPALDALRAKYADRGLVALGVYHPKPPRSVADTSVAAAASRLGWHGSIAIDDDWSSLKKIWLDTGARDATSVSFLLDAHERVRFVHPGPELHPSDDAGHAACAADFARLERALVALLDER